MLFIPQYNFLQCISVHVPTYLGHHPFRDCGCFFLNIRKVGMKDEVFLSTFPRQSTTRRSINLEKMGIVQLIPTINYPTVFVQKKFQGPFYFWKVFLTGPLYHAFLINWIFTVNKKYHISTLFKKFNISNYLNGIMT